MCFLSVCCQTDVISRAGNHITSLGCPPTQCRCGPAVGAAQALTWSCSRVFLPPASAAIRAGGSPVGRSVAFHVLRGQSPPGDRVGLHCSLYSGCEGSGLLPWPHRPGFHFRLYFHLCMWVVRWGLLLRLPWRTRVCPCEGQVWRRCSCLGRRGSGSTRDSGELVARAAGNIVLERGMATRIGQYTPIFLPVEPPL